MSSSLTTADLFEKLKTKEKLLLLDIRESEEYESWTLPEAINIPLNKLPFRISFFASHQTVIVFCNHGNDSKQATKLLKQKRVNAFSLEGGLRLWNNVYDITLVEPENPSPLKVYQVKRLGKGCLSYIIADFNRKKAVLIDPTRHDKIYLSFLKTNKLKLMTTLDTHIHADHISGGKTIAKKKRVPYLSLLKLTPSKIESQLNKIFKTKLFEVMEVPGHTPESIAIKLGESFIFTGDTLFIESVGRPDLVSDENTESNSRSLWQNIKEVIFRMNEDLFILPAHTKQQLLPSEPMISASLRYVKRANEIAEIGKVDDFVKKILESKLPPPANHQKIKEMNTSGKIKKIDLDELEFGANRCAAEL